MSIPLRLVILASLFLVGCSSPAAINTAATTEPPLTAVPVITAPEQIALPIYQYLPSVDQTVALMFRGQDLVNACLTSLGSSLTVSINDIGESNGNLDLSNLSPATSASVTRFVSSLRDDDRTYSPLWGFFNPDTVATYGYGRPPGAGRIGALTGDDDAEAASCLARVAAVAPGSR